MLANVLLKVAAWQPVSITRCTPVQLGCGFGSMVSRNVSPAFPQQDRVLNAAPSVVTTLI